MLQRTSSVHMKEQLHSHDVPCCSSVHGESGSRQVSLLPLMMLDFIFVSCGAMCPVYRKNSNKLCFAPFPPISGPLLRPGHHSSTTSHPCHPRHRCVSAQSSLGFLQCPIRLIHCLHCIDVHGPAALLHLAIHHHQPSRLSFACVDDCDFVDVDVH